MKFKMGFFKNCNLLVIIPQLASQFGSEGFYIFQEYINNFYMKNIKQLQMSLLSRSINVTSMKTARL